MVKRILYNIKYYYIVQLFIATAILYLANMPIIRFFCIVTYVNEGSLFYKIYCFLIPVSNTILWLMLVFEFLRGKYYKRITGRNLRKDQRKYGCTFSELKDFFRDADPHKLETDAFKKISWHDAQGIILGKAGKRLIQIKSDSECNILVFGPPGSGKTSGIAIPTALRFDGSVLAVDIKGDIYNFCKDKREILRFCPDAPDALETSCRFNPFSDIKHMDNTEKKLYIESMATVLIPDEGGSEGNYFSTRARKYFQGIIYLMLSKKPDTSFPDVIHAILQGNAFDWVTQALDSDCIEAKEYLASFFQNSEKNISGVYDSLTTALVAFSNPVLDKLLGNHQGNCISIQSLEDGRDIYLQISQEHLHAYAPLFTLIIQSFSTAFTRRPDSSSGVKNRPILMLLDEFPQLTFSYDILNTNLSTLRSKSIICMLIQQNLSQLEYKYQSIGARSICGNCSIQIILGANDVHSAKNFSDMFGTKKVLKTSNSETVQQPGHGIQETREPIFYPADFGDLASRNEMIIYFNGKYLTCNKINCYKN